MVDAPGFRFYPTEEELISFYLHQKLQGRREAEIDRVIPVVYIYDHNPWDLPRLSGQRCRSDPQLQEWFFFIPKQEREVQGGRPNRLTTTGYWKATGSPAYVFSSSDNRAIGVKRTMVFYRGRARSRTGSKTEWKMNEYMAIDDAQPSFSTNNPPNNHTQKGDYKICRVYIKSKCLRAFDRRPGAPIPATIINRPQQLISHHHHQVDQPSSSTDHHQPRRDNQAHPTVEIRRCISSESSSSSGDHHNANTNNPNDDDDNNDDHINNDIIDRHFIQENDDDNNNYLEESFFNMDIDQQGPIWEWDSFMVNWNI